MAVKFGNSIDLDDFQLLNFVVHNAAVAPASVKGGAMFWDTANEELKVFDTEGSNWFKLAEGSATSTNEGIVLWDGSTGKRLADSGITINSSGSLLDSATSIPVSSIIKNYVDTIVSSFVSKLTARCATTTTLTAVASRTSTTITFTSGLGPSSIDGITLSDGDKILVKSETTYNFSNGVYIRTSQDVWDRVDEANTWDKLVSVNCWVEEGTENLDSGWLCTIDQGGTLGVTPITFVLSSISSSLVAGLGIKKVGDQLLLDIDGLPVETSIGSFDKLVFNKDSNDNCYGITLANFINVVGSTIGGDGFKLWHFSADSGYTWGSSDLVAARNDTLNIVAGTGVILSSDDANKAIKFAVDTNLTSLSNLVYSSVSFVKMTATGVFSLDTNTYLKNTGDTATGNYNFDSNTLFVNSVTHRIGIGTISPAYPLEIVSDAPAPGYFVINLKPKTGATVLASSIGLESRYLSTTVKWFFGTGSGGTTPTNNFRIVEVGTSNKDWLNIVPVTGNVGIGTTTPNNKLDVNGWVNAVSGYKINGVDITTLFQSKHVNLTSLAGLTYVSTSFVKMTAANTFSLDTETYSPSSHGHTGMVLATGTPADNQIAVWTNASTIEGTSGLTYDGTSLNTTTIKVDIINELTASTGVTIDGVLIKDYIIDAQDGVSKNFTITAGDASGIAGTDAGNLYLKAGNAIFADTGSVSGNIYLQPGNAYTTAQIGQIYLGGSEYNGTGVGMQSAGSATNVSLYIEAKGTAYLWLGSNTNIPYIQGSSIFLTSENIICSAAGTANVTMSGPSGSTGHPNGYVFIIKGGDGYAVGNNAGGDMHIYGGDPNGTGARGSLYFGDGSALCALTIDDTETYLVAIDPTTGLLTRRAVSSIAGSGGDATWGTPSNYYVVLGDSTSKNITSSSNLAFSSSTLSINNKISFAAASGSEIIVATGTTNLDLTIRAGHQSTSGNGGNLFLRAGQDFGGTYSGDVCINQSAVGTSAAGQVYLSPGTTGSAYTKFLVLGTNDVVMHIADTEVAARHGSGTGYTMVEETSVTTPPSGYGRVYPKTDGLLYFKNDAGTEYDLTATGSPLVPTDNILDWDSTNSWYAPYASTDKAAGRFYSGSTWPTNTTQLSYDGNLRVTLIQSSSTVKAGISSASSEGILGSNLMTITIADITRVNLAPQVSDGASAIAYTYDTYYNLVTTGAKLFSLRNQGVEKFYVTKDGDAYANGILLGGGGGVTPTDSTLLDWDGTNSWYAPYSAAGTGRLYTGTGNPSFSTRLNYDGYFYATKLYSGATEVSVDGHTHSGVYQPLHANLTSLAGLSYSALSFVKMSAAGTFSLDTSSYALSTHDHSTLYEPLISKTTGYAVIVAGAWTFVNETYSLSSHNHSGVYEPAHANLTSLAGLTYTAASFVKMTGTGTFTLDTNTYSTTSHNHSGVYQPSNTNLDSLSSLSYVSASFVKMTGTGTFTLDTDSYSLTTHAHTGTYEPVLGNPSVNGYILSSTTGGTRSWIAPASLPSTAVLTDQANVFGDFAQSFYSSSIRIYNPAYTFYYVLTGSAITAIRQLTLPLITGTDTLMTLGLAATVTGAKTFSSSALLLRNPADTYSYTFIGAAITAARSITLPLLTGNDTMVTAAFTQTLTNKTINATNNTITDTSIATGDLLKSNGSKFVRLGMGTSLQVLRVNSGATDLEWATISSGVTPTDNILDWDAGNSWYAPYATATSGGRFYTGTGNPSYTTRLNLDGYLYATKLYSGATEVSVVGHEHSGVYQPAHANLTSLAGLTYVSASFVKMTGTNTFTLDTSTYLVDSAVIVKTDQANTFGNYNQIFRSATLRIYNPADTFTYTFTAAAIGATRIITLPLLTADDIMVTEAFTQSLTNKTINATHNTITDTSIAAGDILKSNGTKFVRLARGSALQVLMVNSGGTDLAWGTPTITDVTVTEAPTNQTATGVKVSLTAGESLVFGNVVYIKASDGRAWKADSDGTSMKPVVGMALASASAGGSVSVLLHGIARGDSEWAWTVGGVIYLSTTAGGMTQTSPTASGATVQVVGVATHADRMYFNPSMDQIVLA